MRKSARNPAADFFEDKGFYIILFLCVAAIGISGYVLFFTPKAPSSETIDTAVYEPAVHPDDYAPVLGNQEDIPVEEPEPAADAPEGTAPAPDQPSAAVEEGAAAPTVTQPSAPVFVRPVAGALAVPYSDQDLVYQPTFGDWRAHLGADYAAKLGDRVYAITDGTVEDVYTDALQGQCVSLQHADGLKTVYMGLGDKVKVKKGQSVKAGDVLGVVDDTNAAESAQEPHLHVEAYRDGELIDPESLLAGGSPTEPQE